jgi:hypothetical protein
MPKKKAEQLQNREEETEDILEVGQEVTPEQILNKLLKDEKVKYTTEIKNVVAMTALEVIAEDYGEDSIIGRMLDSYIIKHKVNMTAKNRKRAEEIIKAYVARREELDRKKELEEKLLGK